MAQAVSPQGLPPGTLSLLVAGSFLALGIVLGMIIVVTLEFVTLVTAALVSSAAMLFFKCCSLENARKAIDWQVILTIGGTLALGKAMAASGLAELISESFLIFVPRGDIYHLIAFFLLSSVASNIISSKAGAFIEGWLGNIVTDADSAIEYINKLNFSDLEVTALLLTLS